MNYKLSKYNLLTEIENDSYIVFNTLSGSYLKVKKVKWKLLSRKIEENTLSDIESEKLKEIGIIVEKQIDELSIIRYHNRQWRHSSKSYAVAIAPNIDCNFRCTYCFENIEKRYMTEETIKNIELYFSKRIENGVINDLGVTWYGGEPLLSKDVIKRLSSLFIKIPHYQSFIFTNGYAMDDEFIKNMSKYKIKLVHITLDGPRDIHDMYRKHQKGEKTFDKIVNNIKKIVEYNDDTITINIRTNLDENNIKHYEQLLDVFKEVNSDKISFIYNKIYKFDTGESKNLCTTMLDEDFIQETKNINNILINKGLRNPTYFMPKPQKLHHCYVGMDHGFTINYNGNIHKCFGNVNPSENVVGILNDKGEIDYNSDFYKWSDFNCLDIDECENCILLPQCMGGCTRERLSKLEKGIKCNKAKNMKTLKKSIIEYYNYQK